MTIKLKECFHFFSVLHKWPNLTLLVDMFDIFFGNAIVVVKLLPFNNSWYSVAFYLLTTAAI